MAQPLHILWQDDHLVAVYKPPGWLICTAQGWTRAKPAL